MKPIVLYDANIFNFLSIEELRSSINDNDNYLTDDIVKELLDARKQHCNNVNFQKKMDLVFKKDMGLNDQFSLIISHVPIGLGKTYENTRNIINPKISPLLCSVHHFWLPYIYSPSLVTDSNRHLNSELTWRLSNGDINYGDIQNFKNRIRLDEIRRAEESLNDWGLEAKKLIHTWAKRDADVIKKKYKISDSRLIIHITTPKSKSGIRIIPMLSEVKKALLQEKTNQLETGFNQTTIDGYSGFIFQNRFGECLNAHCINRAIDRISRDYNQEETETAEKEQREPKLLPHFSAHNLRHTFCTRFCENETNLKIIQEIMGHADISTTMNIYNEATKEKKIESFANLEGKIKIS